MVTRRRYTHTPKVTTAAAAAGDLPAPPTVPLLYDGDNDDVRERSKYYQNDADGNDAVVSYDDNNSVNNNTTRHQQNLLVARRANKRAAAAAAAGWTAPLTQRSYFNNSFDLSQQKQLSNPDGDDNDDDDDKSIGIVNDYTAALNSIDKTNNIPADYYYYQNNDDDGQAPPQRQQQQQPNSARDNNADDFSTSSMYDGDDDSPSANVWPFDTRPTRPPFLSPATTTAPPSSAFIATAFNPSQRRDDGEAAAANDDGLIDETLWFNVVEQPNFTMISARNLSATTATAWPISRPSTKHHFSDAAYFDQHNQTNYVASNAYLFSTSPQPPPPAPSLPADFWQQQQQLPSSSYMLSSTSSSLSMNFSASSASDMPPTSSSFQALTLLYGIPMILIAIGTICGNILICAAVGNSRHLRKSITNYFVVSLAIADLLLGICVLPVSATRSILGYFPFGSLFCNLYVGSDVFLSTASILNLFMVSIDRYFAITTPLRYYDVVTQSRAYLALTFVWLSSALTGYLPIYLGWNTRDGIAQNTAEKYVPGVCSFPVENAWYSLSIGLGTFFVPLAVLYVMYSHILRISYGHVRAIKKQIAMMAQFQACTSKMTASAPPPSKSLSNMNLSTAAAASNTNNNNQKSPNNAAASSVTNNTLRQHRATLTLFIIVGAFSLCWIPYFLCFIIRPLNIASFRPSEMVDEIFLWMGYFNSFVNPFIYGMTNREYRHAFNSMLRVTWVQLMKVFCCLCRFARRKKHNKSSSNEKSGLNNSYDLSYNAATANGPPRGRAATMHSINRQNLNNNTIQLKSCLKPNNASGIAPSFLRQPSSTVPSRSGSTAPVVTPSILKMKSSRSFPHRYANIGLRPDGTNEHRLSLSRRSTDRSSSARDVVLDNLLKEAAADVVSDPPSVLAAAAADVPLLVLKKSPSSNSYYDNIAEDGEVVRPRSIVQNDVHQMPANSNTQLVDEATRIVTLNRRKKHNSSNDNGHIHNHELHSGKVSLLADYNAKHKFPVDLGNNNVSLSVTKLDSRESNKPPLPPLASSYGTQV